MDLLCNASSSNPVIKELRHRLDSFYNTTSNYNAFQAAPDNSRWYQVVHNSLSQILKDKEHIRCLEIGAGLSRFGENLASQHPKIEYHAQDITDRNKDFLTRYASHTWFGDISQINVRYDAIFHFFVLEHVSNPEEFLSQIDCLLSPGGVHVIVCPRYDLPGYICPSLRHKDKIQQLMLSMKLTWSHLRTRIDGRPRFWINTNPAVLHQSWFRDADAINLVSLVDIESWHRKHGFSVQPSWPQNMSMREKLMKIVVTCRKESKAK